MKCTYEKKVAPNLAYLTNTILFIAHLFSSLIHERICMGWICIISEVNFKTGLDYAYLHVIIQQWEVWTSENAPNVKRSKL